MNTKIAVFIAFVLLVIGYYVFNPSYSKSILARYYFMNGDYNKSLSLAKESFALNNYNKMAMTLITQSKENIRWKKFILEAKEYLIKARLLSQQKTITRADRNEIKISTQIVFGEYQKLRKKSPLVDDKLKREATYLYEQFRTIYEEFR